MFTNEEYTYLADRYIDTVFRVAFQYLKSLSDTEDVTQNVFLKFLNEKKPFENEEHIKRWLIRVTVNECKNVLRSPWRKVGSLEGHSWEIGFSDPVHSELFHAVMDLPKKYRVPIYLFYYEGYSSQEIADILKLPKNTVCTHLKRGREVLRKALLEVK